jgi:hypothetical protein
VSAAERSSIVPTSGGSDYDVARQLQESEYGGSGSTAGAPSSSGGYSAPSIRKFTVFHYNGLEDARRQPACVPIIVSQADENFDLIENVTVTSDADIAVLSVIRTKWPGANIEFVGGVSPKLD